MTLLKSAAIAGAALFATSADADVIYRFAAPGVDFEFHSKSVIDFTQSHFVRLSSEVLLQNGWEYGHFRAYSFIQSPLPGYFDQRDAVAFGTNAGVSPHGSVWYFPDGAFSMIGTHTGAGFHVSGWPLNGTATLEIAEVNAPLGSFIILGMLGIIARRRLN